MKSTIIGGIGKLLDSTYADIKNTGRDCGKNLINCYNKNTMLESEQITC